MAIKNYTSGVDVFTSLGEIQGALAGHGARQIMVEYDEKGRPTGVTFSIDSRPVAAGKGTRAAGDAA